jgi:CubicO group peptidase (beta-lactamase class C family)
MRPGPPPSAEADGWPVADPAAAGLDTLALAEHRRLCERSAADACLVVYDGQIVQELYGPNYSEPMYAMSSTKSVASLVAGLLIADGKLNLDGPVADYIPEWTAGAEAGVTVRHLLTMTAGLDRRIDERGPRRSLYREEDKETFVFSLPLDAEPGVRWAYSNEGVFLLSPLMDRAAAEPFEDYARRRLFEPLEMLHTRSYGWPEGQARTHADLETTPRDLDRIGQMMLQRGRWGEEQVVPEAWVEASLTPIPQNPDYGLLWWLDVPGGFAARGYLDTDVYVLPEQDLVVVRMQSKPAWASESYRSAALDLFGRFSSE